jgi:hypothetical protein
MLCFCIESFWFFFALHLIYAFRVASSLPDGDYDVTPREQQTDVQLNQAEATQELTLYQETPAATQVEGKLRCIPPYVKNYSLLCYLCVH